MWHLQLGQPGNITMFVLRASWSKTNGAVGKSMFADLKADGQAFKLATGVKALPGLRITVKFPPQRVGDRARLAVADGVAVDAHHRHHDLGRRGLEGLARGIGFFKRKAALLHGQALRLDDVEGDRAGDAAQDGVIGMPRDQRAGRRDDPGIGGGGFGDVAVFVDEPGVARAPVDAPPAAPARSAKARRS